MELHSEAIRHSADRHRETAFIAGLGVETHIANSAGTPHASATNIINSMNCLGIGAIRD
jgi:hypothetical protein